MMNNGNIQFSGDIFSKQAHSAINRSGTARPLRGVRPDKARIASARIATHQPAAQAKVMRAQQFNLNTTGPQNVPNPKRKTVQLTLWVKPVVKAELQRIAEQEGVSISATGSAFLQKALQQNVDMHYSTLLHPIIESAIRKQMRGIATRLAWLLVRVAFDSGQTRSLVTNILGRQQGVTPELLKTILEMSQKTAKGNIIRRTPQIVELVEAVEHWMVAEEGTRQYTPEKGGQRPPF